MLRIRSSFFFCKSFAVLFSSSELKAQVSCSDRLSSVVCLSLFVNFSISSQEPIQPNLAQSILGWRGFKFFQMKDTAFFQGELITKKRKQIYEIKKIFFSRTTEPIPKHSWMKGIQVCSNDVPCPFPRGDNYEILKIHWRIKKSSSPETSGLFQPNLAQCILGWWGLKFFSNEGPHL